MKSLFVLLLVVVNQVVFCQKGGNYTTNIGQANKIEIKDGLITIKKADTVIVKIYVVSKVTTELYLASLTQVRDSVTGLNITTLIIKSPTESTYHDVYIKLKFDKPVLDIGWESGLGFGTDYNDPYEKKEPFIKMRKCECDDGIKATIKSKEKVVVIIEGIKGVLEA